MDWTCEVVAKYTKYWFDEKGLKTEHLQAKTISLVLKVSIQAAAISMATTLYVFVCILKLTHELVLHGALFVL